MANENAVLTYETVHSWSATELRKHLSDPAERAVIDKIVADHAAEVIAKAGEQTEAQRQREAQRLEAQKAREAADLQAQKDAELEHERQVRLTPAERQAEHAAAQEREREEEAKAKEAQIKKEKLEAYLQGSGIPLDAPKEVRDAEIKRRKDEYAAQVTADEAAAEAKAKEEAEAPQREAEAKAAAEAAQKAAEEKAAADAAEAEKKALEEKQRLAAEEAAKPKQKIVRDFQATDENGQPIGRPTHLEADSPEEMMEKMQNSYIHAVRYAERMKKRADMKPTAAPAQEPIPVLTDESRKAIEEDLKSKDATVAATAKAKLDLDNIQRANQQAAEAVEYKRQHAESQLFCEAHKADFYPCQANADALSRRMLERGLYWDKNNLEIVFAEIESKLAPRPVEAPPAPDPAVVAAEAKARADAEAQAAAAKEAADAKALADAEAERKRIEQEKVAANPAPAPASVVAPAAAPAAAVAPTPVENSAAANNPPASAVKPPAGGIEPGTLHGGRPPVGTATKPTGLTKQEIARMPLDEFKKRLRDPIFRKRLNELGIKA